MWYSSEFKDYRIFQKLSHRADKVKVRGGDVR